jgi:hypothetical protein
MPLAFLSLSFELCAVESGREGRRERGWEKRDMKRGREID